jgi:hypothetical protein
MCSGASAGSRLAEVGMAKYAAVKEAKAESRIDRRGPGAHQPHV